MATERKMETDGFEKRVGLPHITHVVCTRGFYINCMTVLRKVEETGCLYHFGFLTILMSCFWSHRSRAPFQANSIEFSPATLVIRSFKIFVTDLWNSND